MRILVTGGAGFIGSHVVDALIENNYNVTVLDNLSTGNIENLNKKAEFIRGDIRDKNLDFRDIDGVIHLGAQVNVRTSLEKPLYDCDVNTLGTLNILETMRRYDVEKIVFASSVAVYGDPKYLPVDEEHPKKPLSPYGLSKYCSERYIELYSELYSIDYTILRYSNVYGERQDPRGEAGVVSIFIESMLKGKAPTIYGDGHQTRDFVYVGDVARGTLMGLNWRNKIVNIATGRETTINQLYTKIADTLNFKGKPRYTGAQEGEIYRMVLDIGRALDLQWRPTVDLGEGIRRTIEWMRRYLKIS
ncbi:MAG TPA: NAD-dependent epimerase/dehydratase family protein [Methanococcaceae archaeon]|uniref:NAD-dependent epimerase/dehydratase family protein n=1 Tax=Methanothermococcus okinawensis TaxID=155863 RepID=A0A832ZJP4_9EURY|nr:NAD-dependent epimerase/dehydratase family protein [Methanococcaceae archaeon]HIP91468.1 NAD-dependent epimerase/dehydratase family protein [Methanothermococcus okinawensis]